MDFVVGCVFWSNWGSCFLVSWSGKAPAPAPGEVLGRGKGLSGFFPALSRADETLA